MAVMAPHPDESDEVDGHVLPPRHDVPDGGRSGFLVSGGRQVHYLEWGAPRSDRTVVMLHGAGQTAYMFEGMGAQLGEDYYVFAPDLPDHGDSYPFEDGRWTPADLASAAIELVEDMAIDRAAFVGASLGGITSVALGARRPDLAAGIVLIDVAHRIEAEGRQRILEFFAGTESFASLQEAGEVIGTFLGFRRALRPDSLRRSLRQRSDGRWVWKHGLGRRQRLAYLAGETDVEEGGVTDPMLIDFEVDAADLSCPVLVLRGGHSDVLTEEAAEELASLLRNGKVGTIGDAGHLAVGDNPHTALGLVRDFLDDIEWG
jgi:pimeloyl-ACP methyl ester carboxylesterase